MHSEIQHAIVTEIVLDSLSDGESLQALDTLRAHQRELQKELLRAVKDEPQRELLISLVRTNEEMLNLVQALISGLHTVNNELPNLSLALRERRFQPVLSAHARSLSDIELAMRQESLMVEPIVPPSRIPILGGVLTRIKTAFHRLVLFYIRELARKQSQVNKIYGETLISLLSAHAEQEEKKRVMGGDHLG